VLLDNPFYFAYATNIGSVNEYQDESQNMYTHPNVAIPNHNLSVVLFWNTTIYDIMYSRLNGTILNFIASQSNCTLSGMVLSTLRRGNEINKWKESIHPAVFSNNAQELADKFNDISSQTGISLISGQISPRTNTEEQIRRNILVAESQRHHCSLW
jgi:hypothetical protein